MRVTQPGGRRAFTRQNIQRQEIPFKDARMNLLPGSVFDDFDPHLSQNIWGIGILDARPPHPSTVTASCFPALCIHDSVLKFGALII